MKIIIYIFLVLLISLIVYRYNIQESFVSSSSAINWFFLILLIIVVLIIIIKGDGTSLGLLALSLMQ